MFYIGLYEITCAYLVLQLSADKSMYTYLTCKIGRHDFVCTYFDLKIRHREFLCTYFIRKISHCDLARVLQTSKESLIDD